MIGGKVTCITDSMHAWLWGCGMCSLLWLGQAHCRLVSMAAGGLFKEGLYGVMGLNKALSLFPCGSGLLLSVGWFC